MKKNINKLSQSLLCISILAVTSNSFAESNASLEAKVEQLQKQVQMLTEMMQKQKQEQKADQQQLQQLATETKMTNDSVKNISESVNTTSSKTKIELKPLTTKNGAELELYGNIRGDASYQVKGAGTMYNAISTVPLKGTQAEVNNNDKILTTLNGTRFGFNFKAPSTWGHDVGGKLEMDFFGGSGRDTFRIRHAYMTYDNWLIGQTWSNFNALENYPETVDASLSVGGSLTRNPQLKYTHPVNKKLNIAVSLEDQKAETLTRTGTQNLVTDPYSKVKLPTATAKVNYKFDNGSSLSGRTFFTQKSTSYAGGDDFLAWGVAAGGKIQIKPNTLLRFDYNHIKGDTKNVLWSNVAYEFETGNSKMNPNEFDVIAVGLTQQITPKIRSTIGFGYQKANDHNEFARLVKLHDPDSQNKELKEGWINMFYNPIKPVNFGLEYMYGERKTYSNKTGIDNRVNFTAIYDF